MYQVYEYGIDFVAAESARQAVELSAKFCGLSVEQIKAKFPGEVPSLQPSGRVLTLYDDPDENGDRDPETLTCAEWAALRGPGVFGGCKPA